MSLWQLGEDHDWEQYGPALNLSVVSLMVLTIVLISLQGA